MCPFIAQLQWWDLFPSKKLIYNAGEELIQDINNT
jgi:hypothetical protein